MLDPLSRIGIRSVTQAVFARTADFRLESAVLAKTA
jgi:hypothetical protein